MANIYCTATNTGKGFFTNQDRNDFYLSGRHGDVWVVGDNAKGAAWVSRNSGTSKTKAEAQAIVDEKIEEAKVVYDAETAEHPENPLHLKDTKSAIDHTRPAKYILP